MIQVSISLQHLKQNGFHMVAQLSLLYLIADNVNSGTSTKHFLRTGGGVPICETVRGSEVPTDGMITGGDWPTQRDSNSRR